MKKILLLTTGGTIASRPTEEGLAPGLDGGGMAARLYGLTDNYGLTIRDLLSMDSSNIQPEEWQVIARAVYESRGEFDAAMQRAFEKCPEVLVESFLDGTEFTCGLYRAGGRKVILPVAEVIPKKEFFDYEAKYNASMSDEIIPGRFSEEITERIQDMASEVYDLLRCEGIVRIDGFVCGEEVVMLEVNTTPGMTANSFIPKMVKAMGANLRDVLTEIIEDKLHSTR